MISEGAKTTFESQLAMDHSILSPVVLFDQEVLHDICLEDAVSGVLARYIVVKNAPHELELYLDEAEKSYGRYGTAEAVRRCDLEDTPCPSFWRIEDVDSGEPLGGIRNHGPYGLADEVWALKEMVFSGQRERIYGQLESWIESGIVIEQKGAYVREGIPVGLGNAVRSMIERLMLATMGLIGANMLIITSAEHTLARWLRVGFEVALPDVVSPYPDERYRTSLLVNKRFGVEARVGPVRAKQAKQDLMNLSQQLMARRAESDRKVI